MPTLTDLYVVHDRLASDPSDFVVVSARSPALAAVEAISRIPVTYRYSDGSVGERAMSVYRAEKVGEFHLRAEEAL